MPPKKANLQKEDLKRLVDDHSINFEGPVPPKQWPTQYSHLFQVIRDIWANRYGEYIKRTDIDEKTIRSQRKRVRDLRTKASSLRRDHFINEDTWRGLIETPVMGRFDEEIVCVHCRNEKWESEYQAQPRDENDKAKLETKRKRRRRCTCDDGNNSGRNQNEDSDEENQTKIFSTSIGGVVSHDPQDGLENSKIPMKPDRVVGLSMNDRYRRYIASFDVELSHSPVKPRRQLLYPFIVLEAKREYAAPGFRSIEAQTAFPIRRFLRTQDELKRASGINFDPLVWFFACQGEEWRLYSAVLDENKVVQVFHLWHGNLESQDGALQMFQIVDFIWTWARDVYRPQIRKCLSSHASDQREVSPTTTNAFSRSQSVLTVLRARSFSQPLFEPMLEDDTPAQEVANDDQQDFQAANSHPFLRWASHRNVSTSWAPHTSIRHSDVVMFSFRILEIPESQESFHELISSLQYDDQEKLTMMLHALKAIQQGQCTSSLKRGQINDMEKYWTGVNTQTPYGGSMLNRLDEEVEAFFLFRTFCQQEDWQIKREIYCVTWTPRAASVLGMYFGTYIDLTLDDEDSLLSPQYTDFTQAFQQLRKLSGRQSVAYALNNTSLILLPCKDASERGIQLQWREPQSQGMLEQVIAQYVALFDSVSCSENEVRSYHHQCSRLLWVLPTEQAIDTSSGLEAVSDDVGKGGAMLAFKPNAWPRQCPRFCLFVLVGHGFQDEANLGSLLRYTIKERDMYCVFEGAAEDPERLSATDRQLLQSWGDSFGRQVD